MAKFPKEEQKGSPDGEGEYGSVSNTDYEGESLEEAWDKVMSIIMSPGIQPDEGEDQVPVREPNYPEKPDTGDSLKKLAVKGLSLLRIIGDAQTQQLNVQSSILSAVERSKEITVNGVNVLDNQQQAEEIVSSSSQSGDVLTREVLIRSSPENTEDVFIGDDQVSPNRGFVLRPGEQITVQMDIGEAGLYMSASKPDQVVQVLGIR